MSDCYKKEENQKNSNCYSELKFDTKFCINIVTASFGQVSFAIKKMFILSIHTNSGQISFNIYCQLTKTVQTQYTKGSVWFGSGGGSWDGRLKGHSIQSFMNDLAKHNSALR